MQKIVIKKEIVKSNNGQIDMYNNKCLLISILNALGMDKSNLKLLIELLNMNNNEQYDQQKHLGQLKILADLLNIEIQFHGIVNTKVDGVARLWIQAADGLTIKVSSVQTIIHIANYGSHFEYIDWSKIEEYPAYDVKVYDKAVKISQTKKCDFMTCYNFIMAGIEEF